MHLTYEIWDFRNHLVHGKGGTKEQAINKELNFQIHQQFCIGGNDLLQADKYLFRKYTRASLIDDTIDNKKAWLNRVESSRIAIDLDEPTPPPTQGSILNFFPPAGNDS